MDDLTKFYAALGTVGAAFVTALFGTFRLVGEKETKVSESRQEWITTFRTAVADFAAATHTISGRISIREKHTEEPEDAKPEGAPSIRARLAELISGTNSKEHDKRTVALLNDARLESELLPHWATLRSSYNAVVLHLNPQEHELFQRIKVILDGNAENGGKSSGVAGYALGNGEDEGKPATVDYIEEQRQNLFGRCLNLAANISEYDLCRTVRPAFENDRKANAERLAELTGSIETECLALKTGLSRSKVSLLRAADALLLAMLITEELLQGNYKDLNGRRRLIERALSIVDQAGAIVIKKVWEQIKAGEPRFNRFIYWTVGVGFGALALVLFLLFLGNHFSMPPSIAGAKAATVSPKP